MRVAVAAVALALLANPSRVESAEPRQVVLCDDLNGDGRPDSAMVTFVPNGYGSFDRFRVTVGRDSIQRYGEGLHGTAVVVDIDTTDAFRELALPEWGPSDDDAVHFLRLSPSGLRIIGVLPGRLNDDLRIDGSGVIGTTCRGRVLHTWWYPCAFRVFEETGALGEVPQAFKFMNAQVVLKRDLPLFPSPAHRQVTAVIPKGESATIELTDDQEWCRIRSRNGTTGWFWLTERGVVIGTTSIPSYEVFDGLSIVD